MHQLGKLKEQVSRPRPVIILFKRRSTRDLIWQQAKNSEHLRNHKLRFKEDLSQADKLLRMKRWPLVEAARKEEEHSLLLCVYSSMGKRCVHPCENKCFSPCDVNNIPSDLSLMQVNFWTMLIITFIV